MLFVGEFSHSMDDKCRVALPSDFRTQIEPEKHGAELFTVLGPNGGLWLWPKRIFERNYRTQQKHREGQSQVLPPDEMAAFSTLFFSQGALLQPDTQGRVRLPERLVKAAHLGTQISVLGNDQHIEIWDRSAWETFRDSMMTSYSDVLAKARPFLAGSPGAGGGR